MPPVVHFATLQFSPRKGEYASNLARLGALFAQLDALDPRPDLLQLPETALSGYFLEGGVRDAAMTAGAFAADLQRAYIANAKSARPLEVIAGFYEIWRNTIYNSAMAVRLGGEQPLVRHVHRKNFLPTYGMFDEERFVERGQELRAFDLPMGRAASVPVTECHASSHTSIAARPIGRSNARSSWPRSTKRSSSNIPYVGRKFLRCTWRTRGLSPPSRTAIALL